MRTHAETEPVHRVVAARELERPEHHRRGERSTSLSLAANRAMTRPVSAYEIVDIFSDGACRGNPGPGGWGALLRSGAKERELFGGEPDTTNNRMELTAVIRALEALKRPIKVRVHTDSTYVQQGIKTWIHGWKKNGWKTKAKEPVKNADLWQALEAAAAQHEVEWLWVKGHAGHPENERADALANKGIDAGLGVR